MIPSKSEVKQIVEWLTLLILLACPLMMLFCMRGMHGGKKGHAHHHSNGDEKQTLTANPTAMGDPSNTNGCINRRESPPKARGRIDEGLPIHSE